jgi:thiosulfate dehydrogenase
MISYGSVYALGSNTAINKGLQIATKGNAKGAPACTTCHGQKGAGNPAAGFPRLAGLDKNYLIRQIENFQTGNRLNAVMLPTAKALNADETVAVAEYYSTLDTPSTSSANENKSLHTKGKKLVTNGSWSDRQLPACEQCHGIGVYGAGVSFPALAGQSAVYIMQQLRDWKQDKRSGDADGLMKMVADKLTDDKIQAVAKYMESLPFKRVKSHVPKFSHALNVSHGSSGNNALPEANPHKIHVSSQGETPAGRGINQHENYFSPSEHGTYPDGLFGDAVRSGEKIFNETNSHSLSVRYVGNEQQCANCHLDAGRLANASPMWSAWVAYPAYRKKNNTINDITLRIQGCFTYSMNAQASDVGFPPDAKSRTMSELLSYLYWISKGAPTGDKTMPGRGYPDLAQAKMGFDPARGKIVYEQHCTVCHGDNGQGVVNSGFTQFPPLWGDKSYNWGAGMHKVNIAAKFIKANMPLGKPNSLSDQDAWDVAAFMNSQQRPQDPRHEGNLAETTKKFHASKYDYYGQVYGLSADKP